MAASVRLNINAVFSSIKNAPVSGVSPLQQAFSDASFFNADSTPDITVVHSSIQTLSGGALTLDLTSLTDHYGVTQSLSGLVVHIAVIKVLGANNMTFVQAAANGYGLFQLTTPTTIYANGGYLILKSPAGYGTVGAGAKDITVAGTAAQTFELHLAAGAA